MSRRSTHEPTPRRSAAWFSVSMDVGVAGPRAQAKPVEAGGDVVIGPPAGHAPHDAFGIRAGPVAVIARLRSWHPHLGVSASRPVDSQDDLARVIIGIGDHLADQHARDPLLDSHLAARRIPDRAEIRRQRFERGSIDVQCDGLPCPLALPGRQRRPHGGRRLGRRPRRRRPARRRGPTPPTLLGLGSADAPGGRARRGGLPALWRSPASHRPRARPRCRARDPRPPWARAGPRPPGPAPPQPDHAAATG